MKDRHWDTNAGAFFRTRLAESPDDHLRIATGFFSIGGQETLRGGFATTAWILVGYEEKARQTEYDDVLQMITNELETAHTLTYDVIQRLANDLGERVRVVQLRFRRGDHAKVLIFSDRAAFIGSANLSVSGLRSNAESIQEIRDPEGVSGWIYDFDQRWYDRVRTEDITQRLRELLLEWLKFALPFDAYLAACNALLDTRTPMAPRVDYIEPLPFQRVVARRAASSIARNDERGHWIIASTGLGKTIMATHTAFLLAERSVIRDVIVIAPARTLDEWSRRMHSASINAAVFSTAVLRRDPNDPKQLQSRKLQRELEVASDRTLMILDESHEFRNRFRNDNGHPTERHFAGRLRDLIDKHEVRVLLLTATPFAKSLAGINNQLMLLPHTGTGEGTLGLERRYPHRIRVIDDIYQVPVVTAISYNTVRKQFASEDEHGTYVTFEDGSKGYYESLASEKIEFTPVAAAKVMNSLHVFTHEVHFRMDPETKERTLDGASVARQLVESLTSSPEELRRFLLKERGEPSKVKYISSERSRDDAIASILTELEGDVAERDEKLANLKTLISADISEGGKVLVFVLRKATGEYLKAQLDSEGYTAEFLHGQTPNGETILHGFAPNANRESVRIGDPIDVLIATDTIAAGVNLQDANTVVHYDPPWAADVFNQRNGRITRFRTEPTPIRSVMFTAAENLKKLDTLDNRLGIAEVFSSIDEIATSIQDGKIEGEILSARDQARSSDVLLDFAVLAEHAERTSQLRNGLITARYARVPHIITVTVLRFDHVEDAIAIRRHHHDRAMPAQPVSDSEALKAFRCDTEAAIAAVPFPTIDSLVRTAIIEFTGSAPEARETSARHVASVALIPRDYPRRITAPDSDLASRN